MSLVNALKQFHAENLGKSTLIIIAVVFAGMTYLIYQTIDGILAQDPKRVQETAAAAPGAEAGANGNALPPAVTGPESTRPDAARP